MHYNDIPFHTSNPTPGVVVHTPNGSNVYTGVPNDYIGDHVTPEVFEIKSNYYIILILNFLLLFKIKQNFLGVLKGEKILQRNGRRVLNSGPNDHVFVYLMDHGGKGFNLFCINVPDTH